ncbi:DUF1178 family protein, partial [Rhizobiaceae bacterium]|nr:DUF1178 family protein [Rhizobiaceae bacterium]
STGVTKALMAPAVSTTRKQDAMRVEMRTAIVEGMAKLRDHITKNADDVGEAFPEEARRIHYGEAAPRSIYGAANREEVEQLLDEGIGVAPLPVLPEDAN